MNNEQAGRAALAAAPQVPAVPQWRSIETAPKDGRSILVFAGGFCYSVEWCDEFDWWTVDDNKNGPYRLRGVAPTHWMPLPAAPGAPQPAEPAAETMEQKNARNARVQARYDELMQAGKHGHYETMFRVVREEVERVSGAPQPAERVPLTEEQIADGHREIAAFSVIDVIPFAFGVRFAERAHGIRAAGVKEPT